MPDSITAVEEPDSALPSLPGEADETFVEALSRWPIASRYGASLVLAAVATVLAFVVQNLIPTPNLTLIYVLPVVAAATGFGWGPSLAAALASALAFDFFFVPPLYTLRIASPSDLWAAGLLLAVGAIVSTLAAEVRRRALDARAAAEQAQALQGLAHVIVEGRPQGEIVQAAAAALNRAFRAPAVVFLDRGGSFGVAASAGDPATTAADEAAARGALDTRLASRAETYPFDQSTFDFWPVATPARGRWVLGVDFSRSPRGRPRTPERIVEVVAGYLAVSLTAG